MKRRTHAKVNLRRDLAVALALCSGLVTCGPPTQLCAQDGPESFPDRRLTDIDFLPGPAASSLRHGEPGFDATERGLLEDLRRHVGAIPWRDQKEAGYQFMRLRRRIVETAHSISTRTFDFDGDLRANPRAYVGRPLVLYGRVSNIEPIAAETFGGPVRSRMSLQALSENRLLGIVDVTSSAPPASVPAAGLPVRVVGWLIKIEAGVPTFVASQVDWLGPQLPRDALQAVRHKTSGIRPEESTPYYETLMAARIVPYAAQQKLAKQLRTSRIDQSLADAIARYEQAEARAGSEATAESKQMLRQAEARMQLAKRRHARFSDAPDSFPTFADLWLHPEAYHGRSVSFRGHVRKVMEYPADRERFGNALLYELWLYTSDSQQNPAVVICSHLPEDFPVSEEVIDDVTVTGYFFKLYRYAADDADRLAPMVLASRVTWDADAGFADFGWFARLAGCGVIVVVAGLLFYLWSSHEGDRKARAALAAAQSLEPPTEEIPPAGVLKLSDPPPTLDAVFTQSASDNSAATETAPDGKPTA